jgi:hypothetical protein
MAFTLNLTSDYTETEFFRALSYSSELQDTLVGDILTEVNKITEQPGKDWTTDEVLNRVRLILDQYLQEQEKRIKLIS